VRDGKRSLLSQRQLGLAGHFVRRFKPWLRALLGKKTTVSFWRSLQATFLSKA